MQWLTSLAPLLDACRILLGLTLLVPAVGKLRHWSAFHGVVAAYRIGPSWMVAPLAIMIPIAEVISGLALVAGIGTRLAAVAAFGLLLVFALAMAVNLLRGRAYIDCGCFQSSQRQSLDWRLVARNGVLCMLALLVMVSPAPVVSDWLTALPAAVTFYLLQVTLAELWALDGSRRAAFERISP